MNMCRDAYRIKLGFILGFLLNYNSSFYDYNYDIVVFDDPIVVLMRIG